MRDRLGAVDQHPRAVTVPQLDDLLRVGDRPECIGDLGGGNQFRARAEQLLELRHQQIARVVHRRHAQHRTGLLGKQLPGHDVRVVLQMGDDDLVAWPRCLPPHA